jgi:hypothetical protein
MINMMEIFHKVDQKLSRRQARVERLEEDECQQLLVFGFSLSGIAGMIGAAVFRRKR